MNFGIACACPPRGNLRPREREVAPPWVSNKFPKSRGAYPKGFAATLNMNSRAVESELETLARAIDARYSALVHAGGYLGLRGGELAGLKRQHVDFLRSQVRIVGSLERVGSSFRYVEDPQR